MRLSLLFVFAVCLFAGISRAQTVSISVSPGTSICYHNTVTFNATPSVAGTYGYIWWINGASTATTRATITTRTLPTGHDTVHCFLTNAAYDTTYAESDTIIMTVDTLPAIARLSGPDSVCLGSSITLNETTTGGTWYSDNAAAATVSSSGEVGGIMPVETTGPGGLPQAGTVTIVYEMTNGCGTDSVTRKITVDAPALPGSILAASTMCLDTVALFIDLAAGGVWSTSNPAVAAFIGTIIPGAPAVPLVDGIAVGTVEVYYNDTNACGISGDSTSLAVINCTTTGVSNVHSLSEAVQIFPNPNTGAFNIALSGPYTSAECAITNLYGEKVSELKLSNNQQTDVSLNVAPGIYVVYVTAGNERYTTKIVVTQ